MSFVLLIALSLATAPNADQRRPLGSGSERAQTNATIALKMGASSYDYTGQARCEHLPKGSIFGTLAERWTVQQHDGTRSMSLTLWKPLAGGDNLITLSLSNGNKSQEVSTTGTPKQGSGSITFEPAGPGGTFVVNATSAQGAKISGTVKCEAFTPAIAEGGN
jgi:hypothetical protein